MINPSTVPTALDDCGGRIGNPFDIGSAHPSSRPAGAGGIAALLAVWMFVLLAGLTAGNAFASGFVAAAAPATARSGHTTTLLPSGKVLVVGGIGAGGGALSSTELYDAVTNTWSAGPAMAGARANHTATLLRSGKVLVVGGNNEIILNTVEVYDAAINSWAVARQLTAARMNHTATPMPSGRVLVVGGFRIGALDSGLLSI